MCMITILMSVYSRESPLALHTALTSLVQQTAAFHELVLIKDGPLTDQLDSVIAAFASQIPIRVISTPTNQGLVKALNLGIENIHTPWIMRFDSDDIAAPSRVYKQLALINEDQFDVFGSQIFEFENDPSQYNQSRRVPESHESIVRFARRRNPFNHMTVCYRTSLVKDVGGYPDIPFMEDYALWLTLIAKGAKTMNSGEALVYARTGNGMLTRRGGWKYINSELKLQKLMVDLKLKSYLFAVLHGLARSFVFMLPIVLRGWFYKMFLRRGI
jgi:glycosyltransferase involved in cell wall biosynthesis